MCPSESSSICPNYKRNERVAPFAHVPHTNTLVFGVTQNNLLARVEQTARHVVVVAATSVHFPRLHIYNTHSKYQKNICQWHPNTLYSIIIKKNCQYSHIFNCLQHTFTHMVVFRTSSNLLADSDQNLFAKYQTALRCSRLLLIGCMSHLMRQM